MSSGPRTLLILVAIAGLGLVLLSMMARGVTEVQNERALRHSQYLRRGFHLEMAAVTFSSNGETMTITLSREFGDLPGDAWIEDLDQIAKITRLNYRSEDTRNLTTLTLRATAVTRSGCSTNRKEYNLSYPWTMPKRGAPSVD
jgi:hypothetical protein